MDGTAISIDEEGLRLYEAAKAVHLARLEQLERMPHHWNEVNPDLLHLAIMVLEIVRKEGGNHMLEYKPGSDIEGDSEGNTDKEEVHSDSTQISARAASKKIYKLRRRSEELEKRLQDIAKLKATFENIRTRTPFLPERLHIFVVIQGWGSELLSDNFATNSIYVPSHVDSFGRLSCTVQGCTFTEGSRAKLHNHLRSHFGKYMFCPACGMRFHGGYPLDKHFQTLDGVCKNRLIELGMTMQGYPNRLDFEKAKKYCNLLYLGVFGPEPPMAWQHFRSAACGEYHDGF